MGRLGKIFGPSWIPKTPPRCAKISQNRSQEPPQRHLEGVRCAKTAPRCLKIPPRWPKRPPRRAKRAPRGPKTPPGGRKYFQNGQGYLRYVAFLNPPEIPINWRGGTKAQPSSIRRRSAERRARWRAVQLLRLIYPLLNPPPGPPPWCRRAILVHPRRLLGASWPTKSPSKKNTKI